jgi:hypothetical protein
LEGGAMAQFQKVFLLFIAMYLLAKGVIFFTLYLVTLRMEKKARAIKKKREAILRRRWLQNRELYRRQYEDYEKRKRLTDINQDSARPPYFM